MGASFAKHEHPIARGGLLAAVAALTFGATTPFVQRFGGSASPIATATLLYAGGALLSLSRAGPAELDPPVRLAHLPRLLAIAGFGAILAPVCLVWGLAHESGTSASLLLNFEAAFTVLLGWRMFREPVGARVGVALLLMTVAAAVIVVTGGGAGARDTAAGAVAVLLATLFWAVDNALTRPLADLRTSKVVLWKSGLGASAGGALCLVGHQRFPGARDACALLVCGAVGYGLSLRFYLLAQRNIGAARTASIFAVAPFVGAAGAWAMGERSPALPWVAASVLFAVGIWLQVSERHSHTHVHPATEHDHAHAHDDGHHDHVHDGPVEGVHRHPHLHETTAHAHPHGVDIHHRHDH